MLGNRVERGGAKDLLSTPIFQFRRIAIVPPLPILDARVRHDDTSVALGLPTATTSSHTVGRCWQSCGMPARQTTSLDELCLMSAGAGPFARGADANLRAVLDGLGPLAALPEPPPDTSDSLFFS